MTVTPAVRLLVVTDDSLFEEYTAAAVRRSPSIRLRSASTVASARQAIAEGVVDCLVLDIESSERIEHFHRAVRHERPRLPVIIAASQPRVDRPAVGSYHAFVRKDGPEMGVSVTNAARVLTAGRLADGTASATAE